MHNTIVELMAMRDKREKDTEERKKTVEALEGRVATLLKQVLSQHPRPWEPRPRPPQLSCLSPEP